jgi:hypothetical protein
VRPDHVVALAGFYAAVFFRGDGCGRRRFRWFWRSYHRFRTCCVKKSPHFFVKCLGTWPEERIGECIEALRT